MFHGIQYDYSSLEYSIYSKGKLIGKRQLETDAIKLFNENLFSSQPLLKEYVGCSSVFVPKMGIQFTKIKSTTRNLNKLKKELSAQRIKKEKILKKEGKRKPVRLIEEELEDDLEEDDLEEPEELGMEMGDDDDEDSYGSLFGDSSSEAGEDEDPEKKNVEIMDDDNNNNNEIENEFIKKKKKKKKVDDNKNLVPLQDIEGVEYF